jgi:hypothetical protein
MNLIYKLFTWATLGIFALFGTFITGFALGVVSNERTHEEKAQPSAS